MKESKTIRVAAVQTSSINGEIDHNLAHVAPFVSEAKSKGAQLILLPELMATGYEFTDSIWRAAEPSQGPTVQWLKEQALKHSVWIGTSFLEAVEDHFYNTFVLVNSDGQESMRVQKSKPGATEAFFYKGSSGSHVVDTQFGRIGVSICYEGYLASSIQSLHQEEPDFVLMPMSAPTPTLNKPITETDLEEYNAAVKTVASDLAGELGLPVLMANKVGHWKTKTPFTRSWHHVVCHHTGLYILITYRISGQGNRIGPVCLSVFLSVCASVSTLTAACSEVTKGLWGKGNLQHGSREVQTGQTCQYA